MTYLLCIDLGTSVCKTLVFDLDFREVARAHQEIRTYHPRPRWAEQKPEEWWRAAVKTVKKAIRDGGVESKDIKGVGVCGQGHGPVLLDRSGGTLFPCIVWPDLRAIKQAEFLCARTGREIPAYYTAAKLLWVKDNHPEIFDEMSKFVLPKDYLTMRLTGHISTDVGDAGGTMMYSRLEGSWDQELLDLVGVPPEKLPSVCSPDQVVGSVTQEASSETGLEPGTPLIAGTGDYSCMPLGLRDYLRPGKVAIYLGSAPSIFVTTEDGQQKVSFMGIGGASLKWFREQICTFGPSSVSYEELERAADEVEAGSGGVLFLPHMMGERRPVYSPRARGVLFGLSLGHHKGHIIRSMMEGVAFQLKMILDMVDDAEEIREVMVFGGGARSRVWRQIVADVFNAPVCLPDRDEVASLGLAILLSTSLKIYDSLSSAQSKARLEIVERKEPRTEHRQRYAKMFRVFVELEENLKDFFAEYPDEEV